MNDEFHAKQHYIGTFQQNKKIMELIRDLLADEEHTVFYPKM